MSSDAVVLSAVRSARTWSDSEMRGTISLFPTVRALHGHAQDFEVVNTDRSDSSNFHAMILLVAQYHPTSGLIRAADHLINCDNTTNPILR
jgi:hypothetical protein